MVFANEETLSPEEFVIETAKHSLVAAERSSCQFCWVTCPYITGRCSSMGTTRSWDTICSGAPCLPAGGDLLPATLSAGSGSSSTLPIRCFPQQVSVGTSPSAAGIERAMCSAGGSPWALLGGLCAARALVTQPHGKCLQSMCCTAFCSPLLHVAPSPKEISEQHEVTPHSRWMCTH